MAQPGTQQEVGYQHELCVLFAYHRLCPVTRYHYNLIRQFNPTVPVVPLIPSLSALGPIGEQHLLPGTVDVSAFESHWDTSDMWLSTDTFLYRWFLNRTITARRYVFMEWDVLCIGSLLEFYAPVEHADVASTNILFWPDKIAPLTDWQWWIQRDRLLPEHRPIAAGIIPLAGTIIKHDTMVKICKLACQNIWWNVFSELRLGTLARLASANMVVNTISRGRVSWAAECIQVQPYLKCAIFHPVKQITLLV